MLETSSLPYRPFSPLKKIFLFCSTFVFGSRLVVSDSLWPMDCSPPGSSVHGILQARILEWVAISFPRGSSQPRDWTQVSLVAGRFFTTEPPGKPKSTGVGSLSLFQGIFPTQGLNPSLLHCRQTLYHWSHLGSPTLVIFKNLILEKLIHAFVCLVYFQLA